MKEIKVEIEKRNKKYSIFLGKGILEDLADLIGKEYKKKVVIITDDAVNKLYGKKLMNTLKEVNPLLIAVKAGEESKSRKTKQDIEDLLLEKQYGRDTLILAFGGGVVGDLAGYIASTYNRGIDFIQVPTSLLALVDSSVGGKTGINTKYGKNLIGTIWQPDAVFADLEFLKNLPDEEYLNGLAEIIKVSLALDKELFEFIEKNFKKILEKQEDSLTYIIKRSIELKRNIVEKDEKETGLRQILNFGHTIGHAIETCSGFKIKHGFSVSIGIAVEVKIAVLSGFLPKKDEERIIGLLTKIGLPTKINKGYDAKEIIQVMKSDKKAINQKPRFIILKEIGKIKQTSAGFSFESDEEIIRKSIEECRK